LAVETDREGKAWKELQGLGRIRYLLRVKARCDTNILFVLGKLKIL